MSRVMVDNVEPVVAGPSHSGLDSVANTLHQLLNAV